MEAANRFICDLAEIISMPDIYLKIRALMEKPNTKVGDFEKAIETDSMLAIRVIRIANSNYFGFTRKAEDLYEAISLIGVIQLHDLLLSSLCMRSFYNIPEQILNFDDFWSHCIKCGIVARSIGKFRRFPACNRLFTLGLLLNIGHALMFVKAPELAIKSLLESRQHMRPIDSVEREHFGFDYCQLGSALLRHWHLPEVYTQMVLYQLNPEQADAHFRSEAEIVNLAHHFCENLGLFEQAETTPLIENRVGMAITEDINILIFNEISNHVDEVFAMLSPPNRHGNAINKIAVQP